MHQNAVIPQPPRPAPARQSAALAVAPAGVDLRLDWIGALGKNSAPIETVWRDPLLTLGIAGVYLIWSRQENQPTVYYVGSGRDIGVMLRAQHDDPRIAAPASSGDLDVSWAAVASVYRPGVTQYLMSTLTPVIVETAPVARAVSVNLPI